MGGEPVPIPPNVPTDFAQYLYACLAQLHFEGSLTLTELECSDLLPPGSTFNTTDGNPDWQHADMLVLTVTEDIEMGTTTVEFGPPAFLSLGEMEELFRANLGVMPSYKLAQRTSGITTAGSNVIGDKHAADTHVNAPPMPQPGKPAPWAVTIKKVGGVYVAQVNAASLLMLSPVQNNNQPISNLSPTTLSINQDAPDFIYLEQAVSNYAATGNATVNSGSAGGTFDPTKPEWDGGGKAYLADDGGTPPLQTFFRVLLATTSIVNGVPVATPCCVNNLEIFNTFIVTQPAIMAYPAATSSA